jgi:lipid-A-disaccharide synthase
VRSARFAARSLVVEGEAEKYDAMAASDAALAASGTVALELALARVPTVIAYRVNPITAAVVRRMIRVRFATITNLLLDREVVPELIQDDCRPDRLAVETALMLEDRAVRVAQMEGAAAALRMLGAGEVPPSERAARVVLDEIGAKIAER